MGPREHGVIRGKLISRERGDVGQMEQYPVRLVITAPPRAYLGDSWENKLTTNSQSRKEHEANHSIIWRARKTQILHH